MNRSRSRLRTPLFLYLSAVLGGSGGLYLVLVAHDFGDHSCIVPFPSLPVPCTCPVFLSKISYEHGTAFIPLSLSGGHKRSVYMDAMTNRIHIFPPHVSVIGLKHTGSANAQCIAVHGMITSASVGTRLLVCDFAHCPTTLDSFYCSPPRSSRPPPSPPRAYSRRPSIKKGQHRLSYDPTNDYPSK